MNLPFIDTVILDLGGVIINLDIDHAFDRFSQLFGRNVSSDLLHDLNDHRFFLDYELGLMSDDEFRQKINKLAGKTLDTQDIDHAWNSMLGDIPAERMGWISDLTKHYKVAILSNTNAIHIRRFDEVFIKASGKHPSALFHKTYYSHVLHDRKPNDSCFVTVLKDLNSNPDTTVFYDDNHDNIETAKKLGIHTVLVEKNQLQKAQLPDGRK